MNPFDSHISKEENKTEQCSIFASPLSKPQKRILREQQTRINEKTFQESFQEEETSNKSLRIICGGFIIGLFFSFLSVYFYLHITRVVEFAQETTTSNYEDQKYVVPFNELGEVNSEEEAALKIVGYSLENLFNFFKQHLETQSIFEECFPEVAIKRNQVSFNDHLRQFVSYYLRFCNKD